MRVAKSQTVCEMGPRHERPDYRCPVPQHRKWEVATRRTLVWQDEVPINAVALHQTCQPTTAASGWYIWCGTEHFENLYVTPESLRAHLFTVTTQVHDYLPSGNGVSLICRQGVIVLLEQRACKTSKDVWHYRRPRLFLATTRTRLTSRTGASCHLPAAQSPRELLNAPHVHLPSAA